MLQIKTEADQTRQKEEADKKKQEEEEANKKAKMKRNLRSLR